MSIDLRPIQAGGRVAVRSRYEGGWARGFSIAEVIENAGEVWYRIRRQADDAVLPVLFAFHDVIPDRIQPGRPVAGTTSMSLAPQ
jgi:hypothetical protein